MVIQMQMFIPLSLSDRDMGARHRARPGSIQIMKVEVIPANKCRRPHVMQFHVSTPSHIHTHSHHSCKKAAVKSFLLLPLQNAQIRFPLPHRVMKSHFRSKFVARRPNTFF